MKKRKAADERRKHQRRKLEWPVRWNDSGDHPQQGVSCDVSAAGAFIRARVGSSVNTLAPGTRVCLVFFPGEGKARVPLWGTVRWVGASDGYHCTGMGIEFDDETKALLASANKKTSWRKQPAAVAVAPQ